MNSSVWGKNRNQNKPKKGKVKTKDRGFMTSVVNIQLLFTANAVPGKLIFHSATKRRLKALAGGTFRVISKNNKAKLIKGN